MWILLKVDVTGKYVVHQLNGHTMYFNSESCSESEGDEILKGQNRDTGYYEDYQAVKIKEREGENENDKTG